MISLENIYVNYNVKNNTVEAVKDVSLKINAGEIFGIVGTSGAGKSTLLRTVNLLQKPSQGKVYIAGEDVSNLQGDELRHLRTNIGMIFQHFNLIRTKTVAENVAFAMRAAGKNKAEIRHRVPEVLALVGLSDKAKTYPSKLSGGQKQRVGIARTIANNPQILLCDEPTSALDLETTDSILELLKDINLKLGITTVIISHEMNVIKKICDRVAVMTNGEFVEVDEVFNIFASPAHAYTRQLVDRTINLELPSRFFKDSGKRILKVIYRGNKAEESIISDAIKQHNVSLNILHGKIEYISGQALGILVIDLQGSDTDVSAAESYLRERVAEVVVLSA